MASTLKKHHFLALKYQGEQASICIWIGSPDGKHPLPKEESLLKELNLWGTSTNTHPRVPSNSGQSRGGFSLHQIGEDKDCV